MWLRRIWEESGVVSTSIYIYKTPDQPLLAAVILIRHTAVALLFPLQYRTNLDVVPPTERAKNFGGVKH